MLRSGQILQRRYRIGDCLGEGGSARVFAADDLVEGQRVALKLFDAGPGSSGLPRAELERLRGLYHPRLVRLREYGCEADLHFYTCDLVQGQTLAGFAASQPSARWLDALADALEALDFLHRQGLRHGDFKPDNVVVDGQGRGVLIDLGCARPLGEASTELSGTPGYLAPELLAGHRAAARADLYAVGVTLSELGAPAALAGLVARLRAPDEAARPGDVAELLELLDRPRDLYASAFGPAPSLLGRASQQRRAGALLDSFLEGREGCRGLWVEGAAGVGRTRFVRELGWDLQGRCRAWPARRGEGVEGLLSRVAGRPVQGPDGIVSAVTQLAAGDSELLCMDDLQQLEPRELELLQLALSATPAEGQVFWLLAFAGGFTGDLPGTLERIPLAALDQAALHGWVGDALAAEARQDLLRYTGGFPSLVERTLAALAQGTLRRADLAGALPLMPAGPGLLGAAVRNLVNSLPDPLRLTLGQLAVDALALPRSAPRHVPGPEHGPLLDLGLLRAEGGWLRLARPADASALLALLPVEEQVRLHRQAALTHSGSEPGVLARRAWHLVAASDLPAAREIFDQHGAAVALAPHAFLPVARAALEHQPDDLRWGLDCASLARHRGEVGLARSFVASALRARPAGSLRRACHRELVEVYAASGRHARARRVLQALLRGERDAAKKRDLQEALSRVEIRLGELARALQRAELALRSAKPGRVRERLLENAGIAASYLGHSDQALARLDEALAIRADGDPRGLARCLTYRGIASYQAGRWEQAAADYGRAYEVAERHHLADLVVNGLANLGTVQQQLGRWGQALRTYAQALRLASSLRRQGSVHTLRANLANLQVQIGLFQRARKGLQQLAGDLEAGARLGAGLLDMHRGELELLAGDPSDARAMLVRAQDSLRERGAHRELLEAQLLQCQHELATGELDRAEALLDAVRIGLQEARAEDLTVRSRVLAARLGLSRGQVRAAVDAFEALLADACDPGRLLLEAELRGALAEAYRAASASGLAEQQSKQARQIWERVALDLTVEQREAFWGHPVRASLVTRAPVSGHPPDRPQRGLRHFLDINRGLSAAASSDGVLDHAIDAAIELSGAERGFVLLTRAPRSGFRVAVARNLDRERLGRAEGKLSRGIAERVISSDDPVLTTDAGLDQRFRAQRSVHAMGLKSVICVPIRSSDGVLGALYLDNRFERGRFDAQDLELLQAFADQVAIALYKTRMTEQLRSRTRELEREQSRVKALLAGQAQQIEQLREQVRARQEALETRYDYGRIAGRSAPMRRVFSLLDRVIESELSVLILGESGTGKELVARAVHFNSPRREAPFMAVNCAALPENLLESELFGHVRGSFTGADQDREGLLVSASGGTLFLDELGDMPLSLQVRLLRALQEREVRPLGCNAAVPFDVRLVCATHRDLAARIEEGVFRQDLYYRIAGVEVRLPPLRERSEDIVPITAAILAEVASRGGGEPARLSAEAASALARHPWPGNVRELQNCLNRAVALSEGGLLRVGDLGLQPAPRRGPGAMDRESYEKLEAERLRSALEAERWNVSRVARNLGIPRNTLYRKLRRYGLQRDAPVP